MNLKQQQNAAKRRYEQYRFYLDADKIVYQLMDILGIPTLCRWIIITLLTL